MIQSVSQSVSQCRTLWRAYKMGHEMNITSHEISPCFGKLLLISFNGRETSAGSEWKPVFHDLCQ